MAASTEDDDVRRRRRVAGCPAWVAEEYTPRFYEQHGSAKLSCDLQSGDEATTKNLPIQDRRRRSARDINESGRETCRDA